MGKKKKNKKILKKILSINKEKIEKVIKQYKNKEDKSMIKVYSDKEANLEKVNEAVENGDMLIVTHNGMQHGDEVTAIAILSEAAENNGQEVTVLRTRDEEVIEAVRENNGFTVDVGQQYNGEKNFDHHQSRDFDKASAGMIFEAVKEGKIEGFDPEKANSERLEEIVKEIDKQDLGLEKNEISEAIGSFNVMSDHTERFQESVELMKDVVHAAIEGNEKELDSALENLMNEKDRNDFLTEQKSEIVKEKIEEAIENSDREVLEKGILVIEDFSKATVLDQEGKEIEVELNMNDIKQFINQDETGNEIHSLVIDQYGTEGEFQQTNVLKVPDHADSFGFIGEGYEKTDTEGEIFVHPAGFFMATDSVESAIESLEKQLNELKSVKNCIKETTKEIFVQLNNCAI